jgi:hypothetical protein
MQSIDEDAVHGRAAAGAALHHLDAVAMIAVATERFPRQPPEDLERPQFRQLAVFRDGVER